MASVLVRDVRIFEQLLTPLPAVGIFYWKIDHFYEGVRFPLTTLLLVMYIIRHRTDINSGKNLPKDGLGNIKKDLMTSLIFVLPISTIILILSIKEILIFCFFLFF